MKNIVLISGMQGAGKTSTQNEIIRRVKDRGPYKTVETINFADVLYEMHDEVLKVLHKWYPRRDIVKDGPLLQLLGTEWGRKTIDENIWVTILTAKAMGSQSDLILVGDCRFENEFDSFEQALRVRLECDEEIRKRRCSMWRQNTTHPSEIGLNRYSKEGRFDLYINTGIVDVVDTATLILAQLDKNVWMEKRK